MRKKTDSKSRIKIYFFQLVVSAGWSISTMIVIWTMVSQYHIVNEDYVFDIVSLTNFVVISQLLWTLAQCWIIFACYTNNGGTREIFILRVESRGDFNRRTFVSGAVNKFLSHRWFVVFSKISYSFYLIQFIFFFYEVGTIRYPDIFYLSKIVRRGWGENYFIPVSCQNIVNNQFNVSD